MSTDFVNDLLVHVIQKISVLFMLFALHFKNVHEDELSCNVHVSVQTNAHQANVTKTCQIDGRQKL